SWETQNREQQDAAEVAKARSHLLLPDFLVFGHAKTELRGEVAVVPLLSSTETRRDRSATQFDALYTNRRWKTRAKLKAARYFSISCSELSSVTHVVLSFHRRARMRRNRSGHAIRSSARTKRAT